MKLAFKFITCFTLTFSSQFVAAQNPSDQNKNHHDTGMKMSIVLSPYTLHFNPKPTHRPVFAVGIEREHSNAKLDGIAVFRNSFGQPSIYVYPWGGKYKNIYNVQNLHFKWTAGLVWGYRGEFKKEVANVGGIAPVVIPSLAYEFQPGMALQMNLLGAAAAQFQLNVDLN